LESEIISKYLGARKTKGLNRIVKIGYCCLCLREENLGFDNNSTIDKKKC
jgi:hypothetical protein